jgi:protein-L-isoaspartate O-methyltransferase
MQLGQLDVRPGHRVLEVGAGTGYNAALLAHLAGPHGHVTTIDVDADIVADAQQLLASAGSATSTSCSAMAHSATRVVLRTTASSPRLVPTACRTEPVPLEKAVAPGQDAN